MVEDSGTVSTAIPAAKSDLGQHTRRRSLFQGKKAMRETGPPARATAISSVQRGASKEGARKCNP